jgi:hypothetical protein
MDTFLGLLSWVGWVATLVCWILILIKIFQNQGVLWGILGILCGIVAFVLGWMNYKKWGVSTIMIIWTVAIILGALLSSYSVASLMQGLL